MANEPLSESKKASPNATGCLVLFFGIFLLVGAITFLKFFVDPVSSIVKARFWSEAPCKITASDIVTNKSSDGDTYRVNISYSYQFNGQQYVSSRYNFASGFSSNYSSKKDIIAQYPIGKETICYVNPSYPEDAVLMRGLYADLLFGFIPLLFFVVGAGGIYGTLFYQKKPITQVWDNNQPPQNSNNFTMHGKILLTPTVTPVSKCIGYLIIALLWNGITSVFTWQVISDWLRNRPDMMLTLFNIPFTLIGLGLIVGFFYQVFALFSPRPQLSINARSVPLGGTLNLSWHTGGRAQNIAKMRIQLIGREEATYRRGTDTVTDKEIFYQQDIFGSVTTDDIVNGSAKISIPTEAMHSFTSEHNKVIWLLALKVDIARYPNIDDEYEINVLPEKRSFTK